MIVRASYTEIVDPDMKILNINARYPGARNDAYIWSVSPIRRVMEHWYNQGERKIYLIGDAGYPLEPWLMTPLPHYSQWSRQYHYNQKLSKARSIVERLFGIIKGTWRCLSYERILMYAPDISGQIVNACTVLHNMRVHYRLPLEIEENIIVDNANADRANDIDEEDQDVILRRGPRAIAQHVQKQIMRDWFPNYQCAWNNENNAEI
ncbi:Putative nuclease HARBI1 [Ooceraea biroi]|uniref:Putative nuclease HARBI1 n=1 Tax=Ooceraea biroi TaxID=2015173 RepID=A0A026W7E3_OOCBI|nr:Putative nuclease HARBI1 [Ooceraea biroi]